MSGNRNMLILLAVVALAAGGYLWFSQMYQPAVAERTAAQVMADTAQQGLTTAQSELGLAEKNIEASKSASAKSDDSVARLTLARQAIPDKPYVDDAAVVLNRIAERSGIDTRFRSSAPTANTSETSKAINGDLKGASPIDLQFMASGTYQEMLTFLDRVEDPVTVDKGQMHVRGRLFNVVAIKIGTDDEAGGGDQSSGDEEDAPLEIGPDDIVFNVVVRMYTSSSDNAAGVGAQTADPAAAGTSGSTTPAGTAVDATGATPGAAGTTPAATGTAPATGTTAATGATPGSTTGTAAGTTPGATTPGATGTPASTSSTGTTGAVTGSGQ